MAFNINNWDKWSVEGLTDITRQYCYTDFNDNLATISASGYFNQMAKYLSTSCFIYVQASDGYANYQVTGILPVTLTLVSNTIDNGTLLNNKFSPNSAISFSKLASLPSAKLLIGNNNIATPTLTSGDVNMDNTGAFSIPANSIGYDKFDTQALQMKPVTVSAAQFNGMFASPVLMIPAPAANQFILVSQLQYVILYGGIAFSNGGVVRLQYGSTTRDTGPYASQGLGTGGWTVTASRIGTLRAADLFTANLTNILGVPIYLSNIVGPFTAGNSNIKFYINYRLITLT